MTVQYPPSHTPAANAARDLLRTLLETPPVPRNDRLHLSVARHPSSRSRVASDALDLLRTLLETPPASRNDRLHPVALYTTDELYRTLSDSSQRDPFDTVLYRAEQLLIMSALLVGGYWFFDGPVRDWLHEWRSPPVRVSRVVTSGVASPPARAAAQPSPLLPDTARLVSKDALIADLASITSDMAQLAPEEDFIAPQGSAAPLPRAVNPKPTHLLIPSIEVDAPIQEVLIVDGLWQVADYAAGHLYGTGLPGEPGNMVLDGHLGLRGGVFRDLSALSPGADIYVDAANWRYRYRVHELKVVWPTQIEVLDPTDTPTLTLLTCTNWDTQRLVVVADLIESKPLSAL